LPPDEERDRGHEEHDRQPGVEAQAGDLVRRVDAQQLLEEAAKGVDGDVEREEGRRAQPEDAADGE
jgi:hypothetical protein